MRNGAGTVHNQLRRSLPLFPEELPEEAFISSQELTRVWEKSGSGGKDKVLPVIAISFCWDTRDHPDPKAGQGRVEEQRRGTSFHSDARTKTRPYQGVFDAEIPIVCASLVYDCLLLQLLHQRKAQSVYAPKEKKEGEQEKEGGGRGEGEGRRRRQELEG